jgi:Flp pilus assembly protein protease CpaA
MNAIGSICVSLYFFDRLCRSLDNRGMVTLTAMGGVFLALFFPLFNFAKRDGGGDVDLLGNPVMGLLMVIYFLGRSLTFLWWP